MPKDLLRSNCSSGNLSVGNASAIKWLNVDLQGEQDSAAWLGLRTLPNDTDRYVDSLPYYIGVCLLDYI